jgi:hypothetical protein
VPAEIETAVLTEREEEIEREEEREEEEEEREAECGCGGRRKPAESEGSQTLDGAEWEDEDAERLDRLEQEAEQIETPFGWEDVRDALDAFDASEEPA